MAKKIEIFPGKGKQKHEDEQTIFNPDEEARREMFEMYLKDRYTDFGIDYGRLAELTEGYVSSDIRYLVDEAARMALTRNEKIKMSLLEESIKTHPSSIKPKEPEKKRIGFK